MGPQDLLDALDEIVYVSDPNTYELLYANRRCCSLPHPGLQRASMLCTAAGPAAPLSYCTNARPTPTNLRLGIQQPFHGAAFSFER